MSPRRSLLAFCAALSSLGLLQCHALVTPQGSAAKPLQKQKVATVGAGGYTGGLVFGFLQRAGSLYDTGIARQVRALGATADTSSNLNRHLSKHFVLAMADESYIKLTNFADPESISNRLEDYNALIIGSGGLESKWRRVTGGTYEKTPNDSTTEVYWQGPAADASTTPEALNILQAVLNEATDLQHIVALDMDYSLLPILQAGSVPYTCIQPNCGSITFTKNYTYRSGVQTKALDVHSVDGEVPKSPSSSTMAVEDLAALAVQSLLSLDWTKSRTLSVSTSDTPPPPPYKAKRPDQEWCVNSFVLEAALQGL